MKSGSCKVLAAICFSILIGIVNGQDGKEKPVRRGLVFEGKAENPKVFSSIDGAKSTMLVPAYEWEYGVRLFTKESWNELGVEWNAYLAQAVALADSVVEKLEPEWVRDPRGVINYAILKSDDPFLSSVLISKKLQPLFKDKLGENIHVVIPDRKTLYLFPAEGGKLSGFGPAIVEKFKKSRNPVSVEVFLLNSEGYKVIGELGKK